MSCQPVDPEIKTAYRGKVVFFCCDTCPKAFRQNNRQFAAKAHCQLAATSQAVQVCCPISHKPTQSKTTVDLNGVAIAFCCLGCQGKFRKLTEVEKIDLVFDNPKRIFTPQTKCPVSGQKIDFLASDNFGKKSSAFAVKTVLIYSAKIRKSMLAI